MKIRIYIFFVVAMFLASCSKTTRFELQDPGKTGINFANTISESDSFNLMKYEYIYNGAGVGVGDLNRDGLQDLIFAGNQVSSRIYLNEGNFKFRDITANFEGLTNSQWFSGVTVVDINSDGWPDVYLTSTSNKNPDKRINRLWINSGCEKGQDPHFKEMAAAFGIADTCWSVNATFLDYDLDGNIDLYILNNTVNSRMNTNYRKKITDGTAVNNDRLYHNNGDGTFTDVTKKAGIVYEGFGLGLAVGDVNRDGYPDIYVSNDFVSNDLLYINQKDGTFKNEISKYLSYQSRSSMGDDMADVNNDGFPDIYTMDMLPESNYKKKQTINGYSYIYYYNDYKYGFEHQYVRNMLHLNNGLLKGELLPFSEVGQMMGISATDWSWSPLFADYDNDGKKDLIVSNGFPKDETDKDWTRFRAEAGGAYASDRLLIEMAPSIKIPNLAFKNTGKTFTEVSDWLPKVPSYSYGAAFVDLDNDGDLDYVVNNLNDKAFVLRNTTVEKDRKNSNFLRIKLKGKEGNTMAIGAKVEIWAGSGYQYMENFPTRGYASSVDPVLHFGLGSDTRVDSLKVTWPASGHISILRNQDADKLLEINENESASPVNQPTNVQKDLLFSKLDSGIFNYRHLQRDFVDFNLNQALIPHKFSQTGPCMAKGDLNGDGMEDIITGASDILPTMVYLRKGRGFVSSGVSGITTSKPFTEGDIVIADFNNDGANDIIAVAGGYMNKNEDEYEHYYYQNNNGSFMGKKLPVPSFPSTVVRVCDYDHDGFKDVFIGARVKKGMFPYSNHSWLLHNEKGSFTESGCSKIDLGMVTDAVWCDYDADGWEDLIVTREYNSVAILKNMNGKGLVPQTIPEIEKMHGIWFSINAADLNKDGYPDFIVGNLGENNRFSCSDKYPLNLYAINLDNDGNLDPILTAFWPDKEGRMKEYTLNYLDELWSQSKYFENKFNEYAKFSVVTVPEMFDANTMKRLEFKLYVNSTSSYILWNNKGRFSWEKLPQELQTSPIKKTVIDDFNNDGFPDAIIGGNDYSYEIGTGYYDALKGIVLMNTCKKDENGRVTFSLLPPSQSGLLLQGMLESLIYLKGDTSLLISGFNRDRAGVFRHINKK